MIIVGDIGNTETKICLVGSNNKIIKKINISTKRISKLILNSFKILKIKNKIIKKVYFVVLILNHLKKLKIFYLKFIKLNVTNLKLLN